MTYSYTCYEDQLPIVHYGADTLQDQLTYVHELDGRIQSAVTALDYILDEEDNLVQQKNGLSFDYDPSQPLINILETFILHWSAYLFNFAKYVPEEHDFQRYGVRYYPSAMTPQRHYLLFSIDTMQKFKNFLDINFEWQTQHESCVAMLRQVIARSSDSIPAKWLLWPGHSEPAWKINGLQVDRRSFNHQTPSYQIPLDSRQYPILDGYKKTYQFIRAIQVDFYIYRPELHYRLKTTHTTNEEKMQYYFSTNQDAVLNDHPDEGFFDVWERQPYAPSSPSPSLIDRMWDKFTHEQWGPDATQQDIDSWGPQDTKEVELLNEAAQLWIDNDKKTDHKEDRWSDKATDGCSITHSSDSDSIPGLMEISQTYFSIFPTSDSNSTTLLNSQFQSTEVAKSQECPASQESPIYSPNPSDIDLFKQIFPEPSRTSFQDITILQPLGPTITDPEPTLTMHELRERYKFVHQHSRLLNSPDPDNALHLSGVSRDPNILMSTIVSPWDLSSAPDSFIMIETTGNTIKEEGWDSLEDRIDID
jgi:hypothetical protein